ncbi:DUF222 domain-containing protein [uncultured Actinomyces sp.]|uniref:HNH endonuclease signature motif containing protein n=1 Tax=uncultured Actinomyces sp. TaxID=249061 RepID=UPI00288A8A07|nr:DUF222 domain-containing protein [uncultured Actinomyces sp.]
MFEHRGSAAPPARVGATGPAGAPGRDGVLDEGFGEDPDADEEVLDRLAAMVPGAQLADVVERFLSPLLGPAPAGDSPSDCGDLDEGECFRLFGPGGEGALVERVLDPGERALLEAADRLQVGPGGEVAAEALAGAGARALSEVVAACRRLASWAHWAEALASACLARTPELRAGPAPRGPQDDAPRFVTPQENRFTVSSEIACRLGVSRSRAERLLERGEAMLSGVLAPTEALHRVGLIDEAKAAVIAGRLTGVSTQTARAVQTEVLPRAPHRTHVQLARDLDRSLTALDPDGVRGRRRRNTAQRHVSRPRPAGEGVSEMRLLMPTADAFLVDATLDAVAASARAAGDERTPAQLRADALVGMTLSTLRGCQRDACRRAPGPAAAPTGSTAGGPAPTSAVAAPASATVTAVADNRLMPDGVPLEGMLTALSDLVGSSSPWWTPSGSAPVFPPPGLQVLVDVTVPLDHLVQVLEDEPSGSDPPPDPPPGRDPDSAAGADGPPACGPPAHRSPDSRPARCEAVLTMGGRSAPIPGVAARALAAGGTWRRIVTDPLSGAVLDVGRRRYRPPAALADLVRARDRACTHPGCEIPARRCDLDHIRPWAAGGTTCLTNLTSLCQAHHRLKHTPGWSLTRADDGSLVWRTPSGARYRREADGTILRLPRRVGPRHLIEPGGPVPDHLAAAVTGAVLDRLERGLADAAPAALTARGPRPGQRPGAFETVPYPAALHTLGLAALLDEVPAF